MARESPVTRDDSFFAGDDRTFRWTVFDSDDPATQTPVDITGYTIDFELKLNESDTVALIAKVGVLTDPTNGIVDVVLSDTETETLAEATYVYALRRSNAGLERLLAFGGFHIRRAILTT